MPYCTIQIVDDEPTNLASLKNILKNDYRLFFAINGAEALELAAKVTPV